MWANQAWASGTVPGAPAGQDKISALQQQAQQYAAFQQQRDQQWPPPSAQSAVNPWVWGQSGGVYGMYNMYGNPSAGVLPLMSVPPPTYQSNNIPQYNAPPPELPPPPPEDPPPPPPPDEDKGDKKDGMKELASDNKDALMSEKKEDAKPQDKPDNGKTPNNQGIGPGNKPADSKEPTQGPHQEKMESEAKRQRLEGQDPANQQGFNSIQGEHGSSWGSPFPGNQHDSGRGRGNWNLRGGMGRGDGRMPWNNNPGGNNMNQPWGPYNQGPDNSGRNSQEQGDRNIANYGQNSGRGGFNDNNRGNISGGGRGLLNLPSGMSPLKTAVELDEENDEDLKEFDRQFGNWERQFTQWREQNKNHPDKNALSRYEEDWKRWRQELLQKREEIKRKKLEKLREDTNKNAESSSNPDVQSPANTGATAASKDSSNNWQQDQERSNSIFGPGPERRDLNQADGPRGFSDKSQGGVNQSPMGRGRGGFSRDGMGQDHNRGGYNQHGQGRDDQGRENWGGAGQFDQKQGFDASNNNQGGFDQFNQGRGGFSNFRGRGGFNQPNSGRGRFSQSDQKEGFIQNNFSQDNQPLGGLNQDRQNQGSSGMRGFGRGGFDQGRGGGFNQRGRGQGMFNNQGLGSEPAQQEDQDDRIQGGFNQDPHGRAGFNTSGRGQGKFDQDDRNMRSFDDNERSQQESGRGRGNFDMRGRGHGNFDQGGRNFDRGGSRGWGDFDRGGRSPSNFNQSERGFGDFDNSSRGRGGFNQSGRGRGGFEESERGRDNFDQDGRGMGGFDQNTRGRGNFPQRGRGGFDQSGRGTPGGFDQGERGSNFFDQSGRGLGDRAPFDHDDRIRDGFDQGGRGLGDFDLSARGRGGFDHGARGGRGGFDQAGRGRGNSNFNNQDHPNFGRGRDFGQRGGSQFGPGRGGRSGLLDQTMQDGPNDTFRENQSTPDQGWKNNTDRWQGNNPPWGPGGRGGFSGPGNSRGRGSDRWDGRDEGGQGRNSSMGSNRGQNPAWWNSGSKESQLEQNSGSQPMGKDDQRKGDKSSFGFGMNEPSTIPGLDLPDTQAPPENKSLKPNLKNPMSAKTVFHDQEDEKIDVKLGAERLHIGPIGVPHSKEKFTLPEDWYDDEEENEHKETENKEEVSRTTDPVDTENKKDEFEQGFKGQQKPGFGVPDRDMQPPWQGDRRDKQMLGQGFEGQQKPGFGMPDRDVHSPWQGDNRDRPPFRHGPVDPQRPNRPESNPRAPDPAMHDRWGSVEDDPRQERLPGDPSSKGRWGDYYDRQWDDRYPGRGGQDDRYRDDSYHNRWDNYGDRRGNDSYWRDERDPYYDDRYGRGPKDYYDWPPHSRDYYDRERSYQDGRGMRGSFDRNEPGFGPEPRNLHERDRRNSYDRDSRDLYDRDRRDPYYRGDRDDFGRDSRDWSAQAVENRTVVDYGHSGPSSGGMKMPPNEGSPFGMGADMPKQGQTNIPEHVRRDPSFRMGSDDRRDCRRLENSPRPPNLEHSHSRSPSRSNSSKQLKPPSENRRNSPVPELAKESEEVGDVVTIEDLVSVPGRFMRPPKMVIILRGPPGSGKTTLAKMIKDREVENGGNPPRILCLDDYFMVETEKMTTDPDTGRKVKTKIMEYEFEPELEDSYRTSLIKSFKRQVDDGFFPFIIVDCIHNKVKHFAEMAAHAKKCNFEVYIGELEVDQSICHRRNTHNHSREHIQNIIRHWEKTPAAYTRVDLTPFIQDAAIEEVEMEDSMEPAATDKEKKEDVEDEDEDKEAFKKVCHSGAALENHRTGNHHNFSKQFKPPQVRNMAHNQSSASGSAKNPGTGQSSIGAIEHKQSNLNKQVNQPNPRESNTSLSQHGVGKIGLSRDEDSGKNKNQVKPSQGDKKQGATHLEQIKDNAKSQGKLESTSMRKEPEKGGNMLQNAGKGGDKRNMNQVGNQLMGGPRPPGPMGPVSWAIGNQSVSWGGLARGFSWGAARLGGVSWGMMGGATSRGGRGGGVSWGTAGRGRLS
ncbi:YLP motif-containing protein 1-like isoform X3 [Penaeus japonicus]|uniref:YLP motif-containing protein 1-like isoform X3 n=1 Tax=Penaeus japonicus TaxID=27405 RepID=UPI001C716C84|nr:YLP motif-containing protein 1-like isoform X3 [Penaeus japonicus]